jgi:hypothetical protein
MGTIMAVVAVLEIHIERNMVGNMKPNINKRGLVPGANFVGYFLLFDGRMCYSNYMFNSLRKMKIRPLAYE